MFDADGNLTIPHGGKLGFDLLADHTDGTIVLQSAGGAGTYAAIAGHWSYVMASDNEVRIQTGDEGNPYTAWTFGSDGKLTAPGHIIPNADLAYDLGSTTTQWRSIYVGTGTIYIGGVALGVNQDNYVTVDGNPIITINTAGNLTIQGDVNIGTVTVSSTAPTATTGTQWFDTVEGRTYVATGGVWLDASPTQIPSPETYLDDIQIDGSTLSVGDYAWTFGGATDTFPGDIYDAEGPIVRVATTSTAPTRANGQLWFNSEEGRTYIKYNGAWVDANPTQIPAPATYLDDIVVDGSEFLINGYSLTVDETGTLLVDGEQVTGGGSGWQLTSSTAVVSLSSTGTLTLPGGSRIRDGMGQFRFEPSGASSSTQALLIYPTAVDGNHIHLTAGGGETDLYLGSDIQYVKVDHSGSIVVGTVGANTSTWTFGTDGVLTLSTASTILGNSSDPNVYIETATTATTSTWTFGTNGILTLPASTPVIKGGGTGTDVTIIAQNTATTSTWVFGANGSLTFPDATVQRTAYLTGQQTVHINTASTTTSIDLTELTGSIVMLYPEAGYTASGETHYVNLPFDTNSIALGTRITVLNYHPGNAVVSGWDGPGYTMSQFETIDLVYTFDPGYPGNIWWVTSSFVW